MRERVSPKTLLRNLHSQVEQIPHLAGMTRDLLERLSQPHAKNQQLIVREPKDGWFLRLLGAGHLAAGVLLASVGPLHTAGYWPAGILLTVGLYLIVRRS